MDTKRSKQIFCAAIVGVVTTLSAAGAAQAATATGYLTIHHMAMAPDGGGAPYYNDWSDGLHGGASNGCFNTGVNLPQGAKITTLTVFYRESGSGDVTVSLRKQLVSPALTSTVIAQSNFTTTSGTVKGTNIAINPAETVDNGKYAYGLGVCLNDSSSYFYSAKITYTYTTP